MTGDSLGHLGPFDVTELLGTGGFASVYRANDQRLESDVAIKILAENHALNPDVRERFIREAQALRRIDSVSVVSLYEIGETPDGRPYLVLELADRQGLVKRRRESADNGWQPTSHDVAYLVDSLTDALVAIHREQLVHRDVTPSNLLIRSARRVDARPDDALFAPDERLLLSDLGLVKDLAVSSGLTAGSGTLGFAAPEQQQQLATIDHRTDIYAASAVVLWFISGRSPVGFQNWEKELADAAWPSGFIDGLHKGLAPEPSDRHDSIVEWSQELLTALPVDPKGEHRRHGRSKTKPRTKGSRGRAIRYISVGLLAVSGLLLAAFMLRPDGLATGVANSVAQPTTTELRAGPDLQHAYFTNEDDRTILILIWGAVSIPDDVASSEVEIAVEDGDWNIEIRADQTSARGWQQLYTTSGNVELAIDPTLTYRARVRWVFEDGTKTDWSAVLTAHTPG